MLKPPRRFILFNQETGSVVTLNVYRKGLVERVPDNPIYREKAIFQGKTEKSAVRWIENEARKTGFLVEEVTADV